MSDDEDKKDKKNFLSLVPIDGEKGDGDHGLGESRPVLPDEIATLENGQGAGSKRRDRKREKANRALEILEEHKAELIEQVKNCSTKREVLELQMQNMAECVMMAKAIYAEMPIPENASALSNLTKAYNDTYTKFEKSQDPVDMLIKMNKLFEQSFMGIMRSLVEQIHKTKEQMLEMYPNQKSTLDDMFERMISAVGPESKERYDELWKDLKEILGVKGEVERPDS